MDTTRQHVEPRRVIRTASLSWLLALAVVLMPAVAAAQTYQLVFSYRYQGGPRAGLVQANDGNLYGTTYWGGTSGMGTVFRIDAAGGFTTVHNFGYTDGANPAAALIKGVDGNLYGTTSREGRRTSVRSS